MAFAPLPKVESLRTSIGLRVISYLGWVKKPILSRNRRYWRTDSSGSCCQKENFPSREKRLPNERGTEDIENQTYHMLMTR